MPFREARVWSFTLLLIACGAATATAATLNVAVTGLDADGCGSKAAPCRSLGRAIAAAVAGDKILVGPGRYGDLDADGTLGEPGEEDGEESGPVLGLVTIDKPLTIESVEGAATTLIDASGANLCVVAITSGGVTFGKAKKGFTVTGGRDGVLIDTGISGVTVSGVRAVSNAEDGFDSRANDLVLRGNVAEANVANGFLLAGNGGSVTGCRASGNRGTGFSLQTTGYLVKAAVAAVNGTGFQLSGDANVMTGCVASGNNLGLLVADSTNTTITGNSIVGNLKAGVQVFAPNVTITKSNLFGNGTTGTNCGVITAGAGSVALDKVCFGAPTGPGQDPADQVCGTITVGVLEEKVLKINPTVPQ